MALEAGCEVGLSDPTSTGLPHIFPRLPDAHYTAPLSSGFSFAKRGSVNPA